MRFLFICLLALAGAAAIVPLIQKENGYVLIGYGPWSFESSLVFFALLIILAFLALYLTLRLLANLLTAPDRLRAWSGRRRTRRARRELNRGLVELSEGDWEDAEKYLVRHADHSETPLLNYLAAARSAQQQGAHERRDQYLQRAHSSMPSADVAVALTQAELQLAHEQLEQALATLMHLRSIAPRHTYVLKLLKTLYERLGDWEQLRDLVPELRKRKVIEDAEIQTLEVTIHKALLERAAGATDSSRLADIWNQVPRNLRGNETLVSCYARHLLARKQNAQAETLLRDALRRQWNPALGELYGLLESDNPHKQLSAAEEWLGKNPRDAVLLLALGRLCLRSRLWGKARSYLEASIGAQPCAAAYHELGTLLEQLEEPDKAMECYRAGLALSTQGTTLKSLPAAEKKASLVASQGAAAELPTKTSAEA